MTNGFKARQKKSVAYIKMMMMMMIVVKKKKKGSTRKRVILFVSVISPRNAKYTLARFQFEDYKIQHSCFQIDSAAAVGAATAISRCHIEAAQNRTRRIA